MGNQNKKPSVLITGSGSGIGAATALYFSQKNHTVILTGRNEKALKTVAKTLPGQSMIIPCDLRDAAALSFLCDEALSQAPDLSILVNNAGIYERRSFDQTDDGLLNDMYETNFLGPARLIRNLIPHFKKLSDSCVINVASTAGLRPLADLSAYVSMKAALISLTQCLALEFAVSKIRFNCVCPGVVETPILKMGELTKDKALELRSTLAKMHPLAKLGSASDIAQAIYYLTTPETTWMTGVILPVDGGIALT